MTSADKISTRAWVRFLLIAACPTVVMLAIVSAALIYIDPYWVWRASPPWLIEGRTANDNLDNKMRFVKAIAAAQQNAELVWVGSSRVYRGVNVGCLAERAYNLGVAGMMLDEAQTYIRLTSQRVRPRAIVVGLDYFMFGSLDRPDPIDPAASSVGWQLQARLQSLVSRDAISDAWKLPTRSATTDGRWLPNGFKETVPRSGGYTTSVQNGLKLGRIRTDPRLMSLLPAIFDEAKRSGVNFKFYIGPESDAYLALIKRDGDWQDFQAWRAYVAETAKQKGVEFVDLAEDHPFAHFDWSAGSSDTWIDSMHFAPPVGLYVAKALGLAPASARC